MYPSEFKTKKHDYDRINSQNIFENLWPIDSDWQNIITRIETPKQIMSCLTLHRLAVSKEVVMNLHKFEHTMWYKFNIMINSLN